MNRSFIMIALLLISCKPVAQIVEWSPGWDQNLDADMQVSGPEAMMLPRDWVVSGKNGMVSSANPLASRAGIEILKLGGNAIDALLAVQWVLNVVEPQSSGLGGGAFLVYYEVTSKQVHALDGREEAPSSAHPKMFLDKNGQPIPFYPDRVSGGLPVGIPGTLALMHYSKQKFGSKAVSFAESFERAIEYADKGFRVSPRMSLSIKANLSRLLRQKDAREIFTISGREYLPGEIIYQKDLGNTFKLISQNGPEIFYKGAIGDDIIDTVKDNPVRSAIMTPKDLADYRVVERKPVSVFFKGHEIYTMPPPSSAISMLQSLKMLDSFPANRLNLNDPSGIHLKLETEKLAFADRAMWLGDPDFSRINHFALLNAQYNNQLGQRIRPERALPAPLSHSNPPQIQTNLQQSNNSIEGKNTTHISIVDKWGNVVSCTSTIEMGFGSALVTKGRGFLLNNELTDFNPEPGTINSASGERLPRSTAFNPSALETRGGKRPRSSMSPVIVFKDQSPVYVMGSPGGSRIPGVVSSVLLRLIVEQMDMQAAINAPRALHRNNATAELEYIYLEKDEIVEALKQKGHSIQKVSRFNKVYGGVNGIHLDKNGVMRGGSDTRREGSAIAVDELSY